ncbi:GNAT family N-acetyltransferase [Endozoicomonas sp. SM1973]|uniref:GNAT family N-acetyltransferase n=1 Tax=Spartinivicinus marinus TaxID=2994442 RepID=A0A853ILC7_9GAMM|nr:GNAT family N-acetyltransferase [Spartinivicinus marinus]MCX4024627.1 GNAT family N-acetyltransferase [Spartinivicinus marinus]NYZ70137.1 GNAT family N-acetyltransferase [Spartinivicinus marinus]
MVEIATLKTERVILRQWLPEDYKPFAAINADPVVMKYFPSCLSAVESDAFADKIVSLIAKRGWGLWAVELVDTKQFIGFVGLHQPEAKLPFTPCVEIGWRLAKAYWGVGYATEAAQSVLQFAFNQLNLSEVVSFTSVTNKQSQAVMQRLRMVNTGQNFEHPSVSAESPLREHVLYKITKQQWYTLHE